MRACVRVCACVNICVSMYMYVCVYICLQWSWPFLLRKKTTKQDKLIAYKINNDLYICVCVCMYICVYVYMYIYVCVFIHVCVCIYVWIYIYNICMYIYIYNICIWKMKDNRTLAKNEMKGMKSVRSYRTLYRIHASSFGRLINPSSDR